MRRRTFMLVALLSIGIYPGAAVQIGFTPSSPQLEKGEKITVNVSAMDVPAGIMAVRMNISTTPHGDIANLSIGTENGLASTETPPNDGWGVVQWIGKSPMAEGRIASFTLTAGVPANYSFVVGTPDDSKGFLRDADGRIYSNITVDGGTAMGGDTGGQIVQDLGNISVNKSKRGRNRFEKIADPVLEGFIGAEAPRQYAEQNGLEFRDGGVTVVVETVSELERPQALADSSGVSFQTAYENLVQVTASGQGLKTLNSDSRVERIRRPIGSNPAGPVDSGRNAGGESDQTMHEEESGSEGILTPLLGFIKGLLPV